MRTPREVSGKETPEPAAVDAYEKGGANPLNGVADLVGNVWQYTDSFADAHTRTCVVRGSSKYFTGPSALHPHNSGWYFPAARELQKSNMMLLMDDSYERNAMTGFRCAADGVGSDRGALRAVASGRAEARIYV